MPVLVRITTVPVSLRYLLRGQLLFMKQNGFEVIAISADGKEVADITEYEQCRHIVIPLTRKIDLWKDIVCLIRLIKLFRTIRPDIVHSHTPKAGLLGMWAAFFAGVPVRLHTVAGLPWMERKGPMKQILKLMELATAWPAKRIYPNSGNLLSFLLKTGIPSSKMKLLGNGSSNGIDCSYFSLSDDLKEKTNTLRARSGIKEDGLIWIFAGRIVTDKGIAEMLEAFMMLLKKFPDDQLWILGEEEPELDPLEEKYRKLLQDHTSVKSWGFQDDIRPYLAAAEVLLFPSYREGFPNTPMQAGAMNCALILSDINGCNEIVDDGMNGILIPAKSVSKLYEAMLEMRDDPEKRKRFAKAIRIKIESKFDQFKIWHAIKNEYDMLRSERKNIPAGQ